MTEPGDPSGARRHAALWSRRFFLGGAASAGAAIAAAGATGAGETGGAPRHSPAQIAARDAANLAAAAPRRLAAGRYLPLNAGIVHFFGYGESLSGGYDGVPVLSAVQPYDNLMIGQSTRALDNNYQPPTTDWVPVGTPDGNGIYPFNPMIATPASAQRVTSGETPGEGAVNFLRQAYLQQIGMSSNSACRFVLTNCGIAGQTIAQLSKGATPEVFNRLRDAARQVQQSAAAMGLTYQIGGVILTTGESDVAGNTPYASFLASLQQLQADFLTDIVQGIAGQTAGVVVPWFSSQPDSVHYHHTTAVHQAILDWSNTPDSDFYLAGPLYQYPDHSVHLTANGYRWHANQVGKAMIQVLLNGLAPQALQVTGATFIGTSVLIDLLVPSPPLIEGDVCVKLAKKTYPGLGFLIQDSQGLIPIRTVALAGAASIALTLQRAPLAGAILQAGYNIVNNVDWGTNICDSDPTVADDPYVYVPGQQAPKEDFSSWNGKPLVGQPYPLNNYLAVGQVPLLPG